MYVKGTSVIKRKDRVGLKRTKYSNAVQSQSDNCSWGQTYKKNKKNNHIAKVPKGDAYKNNCRTNTTSTNIIHTHHPILIIRHIEKHES